MQLLRKTIAILLGTSALFFAGGLLLATPAHFGATVTLTLMALAMAVATVLVWPRRERPWQIEAMLAGRLK